MTVQTIDTSVVRVHQHGACIADNNHQDMGRSRGGLTSKIHAVVDTNGLPDHLSLTPGEAHDNRPGSVLLSALLPQTMLLADRGYDADWIRELGHPWAPVGGDSKRVGVAGDCAGGNLAATVAIACRDARIDLAAQLLVYPVTDAAGNYADAKENARFPSRKTLKAIPVAGGDLRLLGQLGIVIAPEGAVGTLGPIDGSAAPTVARRNSTGLSFGPATFCGHGRSGFCSV